MNGPITGRSSPAPGAIWLMVPWWSERAGLEYLCLATLQSTIIAAVDAPKGRLCTQVDSCLFQGGALDRVGCKAQCLLGALNGTRSALGPFAALLPVNLCLHIPSFSNCCLPKHLFLSLRHQGTPTVWQCVYHASPSPG